MKNLQTFEEFLNENLNESVDTKKITDPLWEKAFKKLEKYVVKDSKTGISVLPVDDNKIGSLLEEAILKEIENKGLTLVKGFSDSPTENRGYAGKSTTWKKMIQDESGGKINIHLVANSRYHYMYASIPFEKLVLTIYGDVKINHFSTTVGGGLNQDKVRMSSNEMDEMKVNIIKHVIENLESVIRK